MQRQTSRIKDVQPGFLEFKHRNTATREGFDLPHLEKRMRALDGAAHTPRLDQSPRWRLLCMQRRREQQDARYRSDREGMFNIFLTVFFSTLAFAFVEPYFFIGYLISIALFGLYQAVFMANAGGAWDNAKKIVETELKMKNTPLHAATVVGDTVGDPFKDTSSVALNPVIKFTTLFGLLAVELAVELTVDMGSGVSHALAAVFFALSLVFVYRSFYGMRIGSAH
jgi:hypothetical protein